MSRELARRLSVPVVMHRASRASFADMRLDDNETIALGRLRLHVIHTPGHTVDWICLRVADRLFSGDTLLIGATGRTDLPGGDAGALSTAWSIAPQGSPGQSSPQSSVTVVGPAAGGSGLANAHGRLFSSVGCAKCHVPTLRSNGGEVLLYSDLLLHDMGAGLDDKIVQGSATGADWRTTPLIGLHVRQRYLHDGRAATLRDAFRERGGEAEIVRRRFFELDKAEQQAIFRYLASL